MNSPKQGPASPGLLGGWARRLVITRGLLLPCLLLLFLAAPAWACLWYYGKNVKGESVTMAGFEGNPKWLISFLTDNSAHKWALGVDSSSEPPPDADFKVWSDFAATLVHQGKSKRAIPILESIEKAHPNEYIVAVNLGTAYELAGENEKALHWIQEGVRRNPDSHMGTEWLHVLILEAKMAAASDPDWIKTHSVLGLNFGSSETPDMPLQFPSGQNPKTIRAALQYQLHERLAFVPPPDPLVAGMIADFADLAGLEMSADHAVVLYDLALSYKPVHADLILRRRAQAAKFAGHIVSQIQRENIRANVLFGAAGLVIVGAVILYVVKKRRKSSVSALSDPGTT